jgi:hypothetical protein
MIASGELRIMRDDVRLATLAARLLRARVPAPDSRLSRDAGSGVVSFAMALRVRKRRSWTLRLCLLLVCSVALATFLAARW